MASLREIWREAEARLLPFWPHSARRDARLILMMALSLSSSDFHRDANCDVNDSQRSLVQQLVERRILGEPLQYLRGEQEFFGLQMCVGPGVLIPRPETEILVEQALKLIPLNQPFRVADLGCGSGAVSVALATERPLLCIEAIDISSDALPWTNRNIQRHHVAGQVIVRHGDMVRSLQGHYDVIVSNPPYIPSGDIALLERDVQQEPFLALDGGLDGLDFYRAIARHVADYLVSGGWLLLEIGDQQADAVHNIFVSAKQERNGHTLQQHGIVLDYAGIPRVLIYRLCEQLAASLST